MSQAPDGNTSHSDLPDRDDPPDVLYAAACTAIGESQFRKRKVNQLEQVVQDLQDKLAAAKAGNDLDGDNEDEELDEPPRKRRSTRLADDDDEAQVQSAEVEDHVKRRSKMYAGMFTLWIASAATRAFARRLLSSHPAEDYDSDSRYKDDVTQLQGQLHDLIIALGQECFAQVDAKNCKWFAKLILSGMSSFRSDMAYRIKKQCRLVIFGTELLNQDRKTLDKMMGWKDQKKRKAKGSPWFSMNVEVLNGEEVDEGREPIEWSGEHQDHTMFRSELMYRVGAALLHGPSGLDALVEGEPFPPPPNAETMASVWDLDQITAGFIATCAVFVLYGLSSDKRFRQTGGTSRIPYKTRHDQYVQWIHTGLANKNPHVIALLSEWNALFFPQGYISNRASQGQGDDCDSDFEESMQRMQATCA